MGIQTPCLVQKGDGTSIYATRDIAAALFRKEAYDFDRCLYVVGADQVLHFQQLFAVMDKLDPWFKGRMLHTPFGMIKLPEGKMSTRKGNVIFLEDVLDEAVERVLAIIEEKNPDLADKAAVAEMLGMGAVVFFDALNDRVKSITFTWDRVIALDGDTGPYVQYAHARICSCCARRAATGRRGPGRRGGGPVVPFACRCPRPGRPGGSRRPGPAVRARRPARRHRRRAEGAWPRPWPGSCWPSPRPSPASTPTARSCPREHAAVREARLALCVATARALRQGLFLMGIQAPEEM